MKYLNKHIYTNVGFSLILSVCVLTSCTENLEGLNYDKKLITDKSLEQDANEGGYILPIMQLSVLSVTNTARYELQQRTPALYSGYMSMQGPAQANRNLSTYFMIDAHINHLWIEPSKNVLDSWVMMKKKGFETKYPDLYAMAIIFKTFAGQRLVDSFGPIPYSEYGNSSNVKFDSDEEAYNLFFEELKKAVAVLMEFEAANAKADQIRYARFDRSNYGGDYATWIKVANTLRLRMAIRISKVNPSKAREEAEAAILDGGVLTGAEGSFEMTTGTVHPLQTITESWREAMLNAAVETILGGYNDPRLEKYAHPAGDPALEGKIKGVRNGIDYEGKFYFGFSQLNFRHSPFVKLMDVSESYFLRAEGALRGWDMGGSAKEFYEQGIIESFAQNGVGGVEDYLMDDVSTQIPYVNPINPSHNSPPLSSITIKWDESASFEENLERIITQKWIAIFPLATEAWAEFRRTGYPRLYPNMVNNSGGEIPDGEFIKRLIYPSTITLSTGNAVNEAVSEYLNGKDSTFEPIFWDVD